MKKMFVTTLIIVLLSLGLIGSASAQAKKVVIKGQITVLDGSAMTLESVKEGVVTVALPAGFDISRLKVGDTVMLKGERQADGSLRVDTVKVLGGKGQDQEGEEPEDTGKADSAYCSSGKQTKVHPLAEKFSKKYGVSTDWVMGYFCKGQGMGAIMLALKTGQLNGADPAALLAQRAGGEGWGQIWQGLGLIGSEKDVKTPPGQLKKPAKSGPDD